MELESRNDRQIFAVSLQNPPDTVHGTPFALTFAQIFLFLKKAIRHIALLLLTATVLLSSTGVSVHRLYCYCKGEVKASLFRPDDPCDLAGPTADKGSCCKSGKCKLPTPASQDKHDCSDCFSEYVKLDAKYLVTATDFEITAPVATLPVVAYSPSFSFCETTKITGCKDPPRPAGKDLLPWIQSFLC